MSTSDRQDQGPLTRKQLREIRLTGSTPVITPEEAAAAAVAAPPAPPLPSSVDGASTVDEAEQVESAPAPSSPSSQVEPEDESGAVPLTRRQVRERELAKTGSVEIDGGEHDDSSVVEDAPFAEKTGEDAPSDHAPVEAAASADPVLDTPALVTAIPSFMPPVPSDDVDDADDDVDDEIAHAPVSAATGVEASGDIPLASAPLDDDRVPASEGPAGSEPAVVDADSDEDPAAAVAELGIEVDAVEDRDETDPDDVLADVDASDDDDLSAETNPTVNPAFGQGLLSDAAGSTTPFTPSFDELLTVGDSTGSQHLAPNTLIFNPSPGDGSLSGPVASTGEILVTGSYELPKGLGSQGHAHGTTDGKDVDAVLIDGELPPASSPTPIAASSAVSTIKPAGEVIRPPAPEKGNKLMLILAIVAGGLALALGVALIVAFTGNVF
ncbi:hypothetical protein [Microbacterium phyllosphaerae]|uniref:hypothetical protein n=1 Tax=Microbacterium phyllosphaerae TaxID=124798 RepID=UPI00216796B0|nr:hypothetical protein [Microbacterium phyllosphaerae]MCS3444447.1 hypothetical protein [Microbacterium phyllosphaerae]